MYFAGDFPQKNGMELDVLNVWKKTSSKRMEWNYVDVLNVWKKTSNKRMEWN